ncbi:hypothetical protein Bca4012_035980 [Brassica carinata]
MSSVEDVKEQENHTNDAEKSMPSSQQEEAAVKNKYGGLMPKKPPLISKDHERAYFDSADWALGKQGVAKPKGPLEALRPKLQAKIWKPEDEEDLVGYGIISVNGQAAARPGRGSGTRIGFYSTTCPNAETIVRNAVIAGFRSDPRIAPGILRMHFHDCFVQGCDGSILITGSNTERTAVPNLSLRGFEAIDNAKTQLEAACPGVVSCADILALAARDSVVLTRGTSWPVPTGRRDGRVSLASNTNNLPGPGDSVAVQQQKFSALGLSTRELVVLVGGHTIGTAGCAVFRNRLFNSTSGPADPTIDPTFLSQLQTQCPQNGDASARVDLDTGSGTTFDTSYFNNLSRGRGVLQSDQVLWTDPSTRPIVQQLMSPRSTFNVEFARAMVRMSNIGVLTGATGEIQSIVRSVVQSNYFTNPANAPGILRMHFHDCFVRGCDGSILLDGPNSERTAIPNQSLRGFNVIEEAKTQLEISCPLTVSCADILALAARDFVVLTGGPWWAVPLGRLDGRVSLASNVDLPGPTDSVAVQKQRFAAKYLNTQDLVVLAAGHTIGTVGCGVFRNRFFNYKNTGSPDSTINPSFVPQIQSQCPLNGNAATRVPLDMGSEGQFDTSYLNNLRFGRGVLESDQVLWNDPDTRPIVERLLGLRFPFLMFGPEFARSMYKMSLTDVKTGFDGEIRRPYPCTNLFTDMTISDKLKDSMALQTKIASTHKETYIHVQRIDSSKP